MTRIGRMKTNENILMYRVKQQVVLDEHCAWKKYVTMRKGIVFFILALSAMNTAWADKIMYPITAEPQADGFSLSTVDGAVVSLDDYAGKFILLNFWATWCAPCRREMPSLSNVHDQFAGKGLEVVGIHVGPSLDDIRRFLDKVPVNFTVLIDKDMSLASWGVLGLPTTFLINPDGRLIYKITGERQWDSPEIVKFLTGVIVSHGHLTADELPTAMQGRTLFGIFKEFMGWSRLVD